MAGALAGAGLLLAAVLVVYPSATVTVVPTTQALALDVTVTVDPDAKAADPATGRLPGRAVTREASDTATAPATGKKTVPDAKASGEVVLLNQSEKAVTAPRGTIVTAGAVRFETQTEVTVSPSRVAGGARNFGMSTVKVQAVAGGASGNVERTQITRVEGPLAAQLSVQNNAATRGGTDRAITYVTADDRAKLQDQLTKALVERVNQQLKVQPVSTDKETAVPWTPSGPAVTEATFSKNVDEEAQSVSLTLKVRYGATVFANDAYNILVKQVGSNQARAAAGGVAPLQDTVQADPPVVQGVDGTGVVRLAGRARATVGAPLDRNAIRSAVAGKSDGEARAYLATVPGTAGFDVKSFGWPGGRLPWLGWRITVGTAGTAGGR